MCRLGSGPDGAITHSIEMEMKDDKDVLYGIYETNKRAKGGVAYKHSPHCARKLRAQCIPLVSQQTTRHTDIIVLFKFVLTS